MRSKARLMAASALALGVGATVLSAAPAQAADYSTRGICGSGYKTVRSFGVSYKTIAGPYKRLGTVFIGYNSRTGYNCAYTLKNPDAQLVNFWGHPTRVGVKLLTSGSTWKTDYGKYKYYAGPVYRYGRNRCVKVVADVQNNSGINAHYASGWTACG